MNAASFSALYSACSLLQTLKCENAGKEGNRKKAFAATGGDGVRIWGKGPVFRERSLLHCNNREGGHKQEGAQIGGRGQKFGFDSFLQTQLKIVTEKKIMTARMEERLVGV